MDCNQVGANAYQNAYPNSEYQFAYHDDWNYGIDAVGKGKSKGNQMAISRVFASSAISRGIQRDSAPKANGKENPKDYQHKLG
jgi:hypothetical protein